MCTATLSPLPLGSRVLPLPLCVLVVLWQLDSMRSKLHEVGGDDVEVGTKIDKAEVRVCGTLYGALGHEHVSHIRLPMLAVVLFVEPAIGLQWSLLRLTPPLPRTPA